MENNSDFVGHEPCPSCGSKDNLGRYNDGHGFCFGCGYRESATVADNIPQRQVTIMTSDLIEGEIVPLPIRGIDEETCRKWDYRVGTFNGQKVQIANYKNSSGKRIAQKVRFRNKDFLSKGDMKSVSLYGEHLWSGKGKRCVVTEGEIDALSVSQAQGNSWPVYSVPTGAGGSVNAIKKAVELLNGYEQVIFCFDNDEVGFKAAEECAQVLPPGKAKIAKLPLKDANEMLVGGRVKELVNCLWQAKVFRPDGIICGTDLWDVVSSEDTMSAVMYPFTGINNKTLGIRRGEIVTITAGSGTGKSLVCREIASHILMTQEESVGYIALEESVKRTALGFMSIWLNKPLHLGTSDVKVDSDEFNDAFKNTLATGRVYLYDHWGSLDSDNLLNKIRYMVQSCGCNYIVLDHISIVVSGLEGGDERRTIDNLMTKLRGLVEEVNCGLILVSHLKRPQGNKGHEDGARTTMAQLRGSAAIGQLSDIVIGCERDQQGENPDRTTVRILKNRWSGETGIATCLDYSKETGRLMEVVDVDFDQLEEDSNNKVQYESDF